MEFIDLRRQYREYKDEINKAIGEVLEGARFILGHQVKTLEEALSRYVGQEGAVGVASGTDGLFISLQALGVRPGDLVLTTPFTFIATAEVIGLLGARPVFADIDPETFNMSCDSAKEVLNDLEKGGKRPKGIIAVSLFGQCPDMDELLELGKEFSIFVIEDACQSFGARYKERPSCGLTDLAVTSFFPAKPLGCYGDGGMVFARDKTMLERLRAIRNHGQRRQYLHEEIGVNSRLDTLQAAILLVKFRHFEDEIKKRMEAAMRYNQLLVDSDLPVSPPVVKADRTSVYAQYTVRIHEGMRDKVRDVFIEEGIPTAVYYPIPLHLQPVFRSLGYWEGAFREAEKASKEVLSLPMHPFITWGEQERVVEALKKALKV